MKIKIFTFGCKTNQYDGQLLKENLEANGWTVTADNDFETALINSCCVTANAEKEIKHLITKISKEGRKVWLTGCFTDKFTDLFPDITIFSKNFLMDNYFHSKIHSISRFSSHTRTFIKIEDGCENFCTYCIVPYTRGKIKSRNSAEIIDEIKNITNNGCKEIVLTGTNLGRYGKDTDTDLSHLLAHIFKIRELRRLRISSIELLHLSDSILKMLSESEKFCPSFHIPLQSGSDNVLHKMARRYKIQDYIDKTEKIKTLFPDVTFTTDIMVGFPGETDKDFLETLDIIKQIGFLKVHIFPFSPRERTPAFSFPWQVPEKIKKERAKTAKEISEKVSMEVKNQFLNREFDVLIEEKKGGYWFGHTKNYLPVIFKSSKDLHNKIVNVQISFHNIQ
ncbi:MAG: MiaB/RimO family radical SAM methylthiotransferase [Candidatus Omnitrophica bacterium]|nr:MiaB/RimO family radical SAM methylthiotransferase [Candidatus Omnitrophota bacterium]